MKKKFVEYTLEELVALETQLSEEFDHTQHHKLTLNLSRGKPASDQLALSNGLESVIKDQYITASGTDVRNYGDLRGIKEARELGAQLMDAPAENIIAGGNSSLFLMHLVMSTALKAGLWGDNRKWSDAQPPKILTPVPGYDRHFALTESLGVEMVNIDIGENGPDMKHALELIKTDSSIKGIWCVPQYSNPTGCTYSPETIDALVELPAKAAARDFLVLADNAYSVHHLETPNEHMKSIFAAAQSAGTANHVVQFASTSKITFAGGGIAFVASGEQVLSSLETALGFMMIGADKVNQLKHSRFLSGRIQSHMQAHADLLKPKFSLVEKHLEQALGGLGIAQWSTPKGGYFVSLDLLPGLAADVVAMAHSAGLTLTPAGATFPYGKDPKDRNVRIAPSFATLDELQSAMQILTLCVKLASSRKLIETRH
ncbi:MAG: aminotransferase class I/II-fold pyridoxal phosphate-dependent enzyme [Gammaproteobacteria bacterium]|nr:aminotransferase class I/II-fold pyridoxal phosphate-dependent enzyme [Gammaproteobacteria bacterium]